MAGNFRVNVKVPELESAMSKIGAYNGKMALRVEEAISNSTKAIGRGARNRVRSVSGTLKKSIKTKFNKKGCYGEIYSTAPHAHLIEMGVKRSKVEAGKGKFLPLSVGENVFFRKKATIPARPARPFLKPAFEEEKPNLIRNIEKAVKP